MIRLDNINKSYKVKGDVVTAIEAISLSVEAGEIFGVIGPSGAGKSTLIRCVNLLERPTNGRVYIDNQDITQCSAKALRMLRHNIGMVFQHFNLLSSRTVFENISFPLALMGKAKREIYESVTKLLSLTGLSDKQDVYPSQLSGGQKQRVAIARALATQPKILLCDEMTSALDPETTHAILGLLKKLQQELSLTVLLITHEMDVIKRIADRVAVIDAGRIVEVADVVQLFKNPESSVARQFIRSDLKRYLPENIKSVLQSQPFANAKTLLQIAFIGQVATQPIIEKLVNHAKVHVNILQANLELLRNETIGVMTVDLQGRQEDVQDAIVYLQQFGLGVEVIGYVPGTISTVGERELANA